MAQQIDLSWALAESIELDDADLGRVELRHEPLGEVAFPTGRIVACDPFVFPELPPFVTEVEPGRYPLVLSVARFADEDDGLADVRVAYAVLVFSQVPVVRWETALRPGQATAKLPAGHIFGYGVDSGTGTLMDASAADLLRLRYDEDRDYANTIIGQMNSSPAKSVRGLLLTLDEETGLNAPFFETGWGDGFYASYFGYAADGITPAYLVTDFGVVEAQTTGEP